MTESQTLGSRIRRLRREAGLSQMDLAGDNLSASYISLLEAGKRTPSPEVLEQIAARLGCGPEHLLELLAPERHDIPQTDLRYAEISLRNGDPETALATYTAVRDKAARAGQESIRLTAEYGVAQALEHAGRLEEATDRYQALLDHAGYGQSLVPRLTVAVALCRCYRETGDLAHAIDLATTTLEEARQLRLTSTVLGVELLATLVGLYCERGDLHRASFLARTAIEEAEGIKDRKALGAAYWNAGAVAHRSGASADALLLLERALAIYSEGDDARALSRLRNAYASVLMQSETADIAEAKSQLTRSAENLASHGSTVDMAYCETALARACLLEGNPREAEQHARRSLELLGTGHRLETARTLLVLAGSQLQLGDTAAAEEGSERAALLLEASEADRQAASAWNDLGELLERSGRAERAVWAYRQSLRCLGQRSSLLPTAGGSSLSPAGAPGTTARPDRAAGRRAG
ncbi:helix-turn-helix domain-containing protein [Streptomyces sp. NPDC058612]|uniref:helix-turn-helix domain-containing protein n=1 Tax=Streptomyces sp. NPDC058612 TaxID=3346555 RepID=UPI0036629C50